LPTKVPLGHLKEKVRNLIAADGKRDRRLWEIATLAVLRDRLRSGDVWVEGGRAFRPLEAQLIGVPSSLKAWCFVRVRCFLFRTPATTALLARRFSARMRPAA
jgi:hypothetical protein